MIKKGKGTIPLSTKCGLVDMYMACRLKSMANVTLEVVSEVAGALRAFGDVVQQWTVAAHFKQDNDGCWMEPAGTEQPNIYPPHQC